MRPESRTVSFEDDFDPPFETLVTQKIKIVNQNNDLMSKFNSSFTKKVRGKIWESKKSTNKSYG